jgi:predicted AAA+ superfamily ATPase
MVRTAMHILEKWKESPNRKPLIIRGARQVGKTWLMKEFGSIYYKKTVYVNFDNNTMIRDLFDKDLEINRLVTGLELYSGTKIDPESTLIIFDEIQEAPKALKSLKYFFENAPEYHIIAAGSLLGVAMHQGTSFPVGKVDYMDLFPMSFSEFLTATGKEKYCELLQKHDFEMISVFKNVYIDALKQYCFVGGMPEVVADFSEKNDFNRVREIQRRLLMSYEQDFSKHAPYNEVPRLRMLWQSVSSQLAKENKKFIYGLVREGARARDYETALLWLSDCGLIHRVHRVSKPGIPLRAYEDMKAFKLYMLDVGLLSCMVNLSQDVLLKGNSLFSEFKGALTEQYVLQQLKTIQSMDAYYWTNDSKNNAEVDFVVQLEGEVIPIEVKAEINLHAKSLKVYYEKFKPKFCLRTSMNDFKKESWVINLPLYAISEISMLTKE